MFFEYVQLTGMGGAPFSLDFLSRVFFWFRRSRSRGGRLQDQRSVGICPGFGCGGRLVLYNERMIRF